MATTPAWTKTCNLWVHAENTKPDVYVHPDYFSGIKEGQLLALYHPITPGAADTTPEERRCIVQVLAFEKQPQLRISISREIADKFHFLTPQVTHPNICVYPIEPDTVAAEHIELSLKDQYVGRADMWRLKQSMIGTCVYEGKQLRSKEGINAQVKKIYRKGKPDAIGWSVMQPPFGARTREIFNLARSLNCKKAYCGYVTDDTRLIFRSESAKFFIFLQMCKEMWDFDEDGELFFEKAVQSFLPDLFRQWNERGTNHIVSIVLFSRVFYSEHDAPEVVGDQAICYDEEGRQYRDFYKVIADWETRSDWMTVIVPLKEEFMQLQKEILMRYDARGYQVLCGQNSMAFDGNVLEAVNLALNPFDKHYIDRDLMRTGLSIVMVTPGSGKFKVARKLLRLTTERMTDNGIAMDLVCLGKVPLHLVPLFIFVAREPKDHSDGGSTTPTTPTSIKQPQLRMTAINPINTAANSAAVPPLPPKRDVWDPLYYDDDEPVSQTDMADALSSGLGLTFTDDHPSTEDLPPLQTFYTMPHWVDTSFYTGPTTRYVKLDKYAPRCKMYEMQMMGIMEHEIASISIPYLEDKVGEDSDNGKETGNGDEEDEENEAGEAHRITQQRYPRRANSIGSSRELSTIAPTTVITSPPRSPRRRKPRPPVPKSPRKPEKFDYDAYDDAVFSGPDSHRPYKFQPIASPTLSASSIHAGSSVSGTSNQRRSMDATEMLLRTEAVELDVSKQSRSAPKTSFFPIVPKISEFIQDRLPFPDMSGGGANKDGPSTMVSPPQGGGTAEGSFFRTWQGATPSYATLSGRRSMDAMSSSRGADFFSNANAGTTVPRKGSARRNTATTLLLEGRGTALHGIVAGGTPESGAMIIEKTSVAPTAQEDESVVMSSSTVQAMAIPNNSRENRRNPSTRDPTPSPGGAGSFPSASSSFGKDRPSRFLIAARASPGRAIQPRHTTKQATTINPSNPSKNVYPFTSHLRRWQHALPTPSPSETPTSETPIVHWQSMCTPACLPLTTDYFPSDEELTEFYTQFAYAVSVSDDVNLYQAGDLSDQKNMENLITELMSQRLAQGFQFIVPDAVAQYARKMSGSISKDLLLGGGASVISDSHGDGVSNGSTMNPPNTLMKSVGEILQDGGLEAKQSITISALPYYLSMGHHVHKIDYDASGRNVQVKRYVRIINYNVTPMNYKCVVWPRQLDGYRSKDVTFSYPNLKYPWNYLDHLVAGYQHDLTDNLRYWRSRFVLIPMETLPTTPPPGALATPGLDEEELRLEYFQSFLQVFKKAKWSTPQEREEMRQRKKKELSLYIVLKYTTMDLSAHISNEVRHARVVAEEAASGVPSSPRRTSITSLDSQPLNRDATLSAIALAMQSPVTGIKMHNQRWHVRLFESVFMGNEFVEWLIREFADVDTREDAVTFGNQLMERGLFEHSLRKHKFLDGHYFYQFKGDYAPKMRNWFGGSKKATAPNPAPSPLIQKDFGTVSEKPKLQIMTSPRPSSSTSSMTDPKNDQPLTFEMSKKMIIDVDEKKRSDRREMAILHYDAVHNIHNCYHFQLNWNGCTAQLIDDMLRSWVRMAERCGLKLVEASVDQAYTDTENGNPFQCPVPISLAVPPPDISTSMRRLHPQIEIPRLFFETELVKHHGFVLDVEADSRFPEGVKFEYTYLKTEYHYDQYVHVSGVAFIQVAPPGEGFFWVNNRLLTSHTPALQLPTSVVNAPPHPDVLRLNFEEFCSNEERLKEFWELTLNKLSTRPGMAWILKNQQPDVVVAGLEIDAVTPVSEPLSEVVTPASEPLSEEDDEGDEMDKHGKLQ
ncbi:hypothetical protein BC938DRAFT_484206 [Jimgerdemannia flammicorona]|uniref:Vacuolar membrane-associated protein IML1 n=1 Tax=Jimgerdemannia flammicorona TaxID=994334 RepID=A0A433QAC7_9FUNG|nr:hypothetical protein BC938DRAFT_484206 [Jimgerdemannia flammicorona]